MRHTVLLVLAVAAGLVLEAGRPAGAQPLAVRPVDACYGRALTDRIVQGCASPACALQCARWQVGVMTSESGFDLCVSACRKAEASARLRSVAPVAAPVLVTKP
ncbi:hypothetical protein [Faunimonas sp. B44]|uniref:hypothetical protein n=1 Tax=Faunimonas sp. B44 TaxID=3461493 RepID=UPI0040446165